MKPLIAIASCARDRVGQVMQAQLLRGKADYRFFLGAGNSDAAEDEVILPVRDDYLALPVKMRAAYRWALERSYDYVFKCDRDTWMDGERLIASGLEHFEQGHDFVGLVGNPGDCCGGGAGYWLSSKAMIAYLESYDERQIALTPRQVLEDWCLFWSLDRANPRISPVCDRRYGDSRIPPRTEEHITWNPWKP